MQLGHKPRGQVVNGNGEPRPPGSLAGQAAGMKDIGISSHPIHHGRGGVVGSRQRGERQLRAPESGYRAVVMERKACIEGRKSADALARAGGAAQVFDPVIEIVLDAGAANQQRGGIDEHTHCFQDTRLASRVCGFVEAGGKEFNAETRRHGEKRGWEELEVRSRKNSHLPGRAEEVEGADFINPYIYIIGEFDFSGGKLMHGYTAKDLGRAFRTVRENTIQIAEDIPADKYGFRPAEGSQSVAETLAHIAVIPEMQRRIHSDRMTDLTVEFFQTNMPLVMAEAAQLTTKFDIVKADSLSARGAPASRSAACAATRPVPRPVQGFRHRGHRA